jgi:FMN phosphatase YigB (HAD superfamily)
MGAGGGAARPRVVFLDWFGTLCMPSLWQTVPPDHPEYALLEAVGRVVFDMESDLVLDWMRGRHTSWEIIERACAQTGASFAVAWPAFLEDFRTMRITPPALVEAIATLRLTGTQVVIATDNVDAFDDVTVPAAGLREVVDGILNSAAIGCLKRDIANGKSLFFAPWLEANGVTPEECVLIDDNALLPSILGEVGIRVLRVGEGVDALAHIRGLEA